MVSSVVLQAADKAEFSVHVEVARRSKVVCEYLDSHGDLGDGDAPTFPVQGVNAATLERVVKFLEHEHSNPSEPIERPIRSNSLLENGVSEWADQFVKLEANDLFELVLAANFLDIEPLLDLSCAKVATMLKNRSTSEIRQTFGLTNDFDPAEEARIREENRWCEDA